MNHPGPNVAAIECRQTQILIKASLASDFAGLGTSTDGVKNYLLPYSSVHNVDTSLL
jgi:hypothetical protein